MSFLRALDNAQSNIAAKLGEPIMMNVGGAWVSTNPDGNPIHMRIEEDQLLLDDVGTRQDSEAMVTIGIVPRYDTPGIKPCEGTLISILDPSPYAGRVYEVVREMSDSFRNWRFTMVESKDTPA